MIIPNFDGPVTTKYGVIVTDPPWPVQKGNARAVRPNQGKALDYKTITFAEIQDLHERVLPFCHEKHNMFVWAVDKYLYEAEDIFEGLGYKLHCRMVWDKLNGVAPAFTVRFSHEYLLWFYPPGKMRKPRVDLRGVYTTVMQEESTRHSAKPNCAYYMLNDMFPNTAKLDMFARTERAGWDSFGDEL